MNNKDEDLLKNEITKIIEKFDNSDFSRFVIIGGKKCGKTEMLKYYTQNYNNDFKSIFYVDYKDFSYKARLSEKEYTYYYELIFVKKMINSIKIYNSNNYNNFRVFENYINLKLNKFNEFLMTRIYSNDKIIFDKGSLVNKLLDNFDITKVNEINLIIDHFDFVGESSERFQKFMSSYFDYFGKIIVTTNENLNDDKKECLGKKGYKIIEISYNKELLVIKNILLLYLSKMEQGIVYSGKYLERLSKVYKCVRDDNFCRYLINRCDGNIDMMTQSLRYFILDGNMKDAIDSSIRLQKEIDSLTYKRILHL